MPRVIGIDPGTVSFDVCGLDDGHVFLDTTIPSAEIGANPQILVDVLQAAAPLDLIIGPSGYGLPWIHIQDFGEQEQFLFILVDERERNQVSVLGGMGEMIASLKASRLPLVYMPGVIHLPTVPEHRKTNKIDMGTADKLCCLALGIFDQARRHQIAYEATNFIFVEVGGAFTAVMTVQDGQVIDGLGGSSGAPGYYSLGAMDGELAYLLGSFPKSVLFSGGVAAMTGQPTLAPDEALAQRGTNPAVQSAWEALFEGVAKCVAAEMMVLPAPREILLSGRLCRIPAVREELARRVGHFAPIQYISGIARTAKEAAQGAALIADGMAGGQYAGLVETMRLKEARGTVLDYLHVSLADEVRRKYLTAS